MVQIYHCPHCGRELDKLALHSFWQGKKFRKIRRLHDSILNYALANDRSDLVWFFVFDNFCCYCQRQFVAVHRTRFVLNPDLPFRHEDFHLVHIEGADFSQLEGVYLGKRVRGIIAAFLNRWNCLANTAIICTPFISSKYTSGEWEWLVSNIYPFKVTIITRPQSHRLLRRLPIFNAGTATQVGNVLVNSNKDDVYEAVEHEILRPLLLDLSVLRYQKFHAKFFAGLFPDRVEVIHSSYNLFSCENRQLENLSVRVYTHQDFFASFMHPFGIESYALRPILHWKRRTEWVALFVMRRMACTSQGVTIMKAVLGG